MDKLRCQGVIWPWPTLTKYFLHAWQDTEKFTKVAHWILTIDGFHSIGSLTAIFSMSKLRLKVAQELAHHLTGVEPGCKPRSLWPNGPYNHYVSASQAQACSIYFNDGNFTQERLLKSILETNDILEFCCKSPPAPTQFLKLQNKQKQKNQKKPKFNLGTISSAQDGAYRPEQAGGVWGSPFHGAMSQVTIVHASLAQLQDLPSRSLSRFPSMRVNLSHLLILTCLYWESASCGHQGKFFLLPCVFSLWPDGH